MTGKAPAAGPLRRVADFVDWNLPTALDNAEGRFAAICDDRDADRAQG